MSNDSTANPQIILEIPQGVLDNALEVTGRNPLLWLRDILEATEAARNGIPKERIASGIDDLSSRVVTMATLVDQIVDSMVELVMFQAIDPIDPIKDAHADPKTEIQLG